MTATMKGMGLLVRKAVWLGGCVAALMLTLCATHVEAQGTASLTTPSAKGDQLMQTLDRFDASTDLDQPLGSLTTLAQPENFDPQKNPRVLEVASQIRCATCGNDTVANANVALAKTMRDEIVAAIDLGRTNDQIIRGLIAKYGQGILIRTPLTGSTLILWLVPLGLAIILCIYVLTKVIFTKMSLAAPKVAEAEFTVPPTTVKPRQVTMQQAIEFLRGDRRFDGERLVRAHIPGQAHEE